MKYNKAFYDYGHGHLKNKRSKCKGTIRNKLISNLFIYIITYCSLKNMY